MPPSQAPPSAAPQPQCNACNHGSMHTHTHMHACQSTGFKLNHQPCTARSGTAGEGVRPNYTHVHLAVYKVYFGFACMPHHASACTLGHAHGAGPLPHQGQCTCPAPRPKPLLLLVACWPWVCGAWLASPPDNPTAHKPQPPRVIPWHNNLNWGQYDCPSLFESFFFPHWKQALACQWAGPR